MSANIWDQRTFKILTLLVLFLAPAVLWSWFEPLGSSIQREVASVTETQQPSHSVAGYLSHPVTWNWTLATRDQHKEIDGTHLRLKTKIPGFTPNAVTNETNGFTASVFPVDRGYTTDFIELKEGVNHILVQGTDSHGKELTKQIEVTRRMPASVSEPQALPN